MGWTFEEFPIKASPGSLGLHVTEDCSRIDDIPSPEGFKVLSVKASSQSFGKIQKDDVITHVDGLKMMGMTEFVNAMKEKKDMHKIITVHRLTFKPDIVNVDSDINMNVDVDVDVDVDVNMEQKETEKGEEQRKLVDKPEMEIVPENKSSRDNSGREREIAQEEGANNNNDNDNNNCDSNEEKLTEKENMDAGSKSDKPRNSSNDEGVQKRTGGGGGGENETGKNGNGNGNDDNNGEDENSNKENMTEKERQKKKRRAASPINDPHALCDICQEPDGYHGMNMQRCCECNVYVHEECYGLFNYNENLKYRKWKCHACAVVGRKVTVSKENEKMRKITIQSRPKRCALCPIKTGMHAMHPLYDQHGKEGRPVIDKRKKTSVSAGVDDGDGRDDEEGTLWVHTLCALFIGCNKMSDSVVYGCDAKGEWSLEDGEESDDSDGDDDTLDLEYKKRSDSSPLLSTQVHHFVIAYDDAHLVKKAKELRQLKCFICRNDDKRSRRIPVRCAYESCKTAFHVGCARWGVPEGEKEGRIRFDNIEGFAAGYCKVHSIKSRRRRAKQLEEEDDEEEAEYEESEAEDTDDEMMDVDEDFFDNDIDEPEPQKHEVLVKKKKAKRYKTGGLQRNQDSASFEKKRQIEDMSEHILSYYRTELEAGVPFEEVKKKVNRRWKQSHSKAILRTIYGQIELDLKELEDQYSAKPLDSDEHDLEAQAEEERKAAAKLGQWVNLFEPHYKHGLSMEWDTYEIVSESELCESE